MKVTRLPDADPRPRRVAVGMFDGVHRGHREVIGGADTVITFDPHPLSVLAPARAPLLLTTLERKAELVASLGVDELVVVPFDQAFAALTAEEFVDVVLVQRMAATHVSVGENFRFGHRAQGDTDTLRADGRFEVHVEPLLEVDGEVVHGDKRGRELGFPTANLLPADGYVTPGHGVYACRATVASGETYAAATNIGVRPMFETGRGELIEAYLLDFDDDLYDQELRIDFHHRLRGERRFAGVDALLEQMARDVEETRRLLRFPAA